MVAPCAEMGSGHLGLRLISTVLPLSSSTILKNDRGLFGTLGIGLMIQFSGRVLVDHMRSHGFTLHYDINHKTELFPCLLIDSLQWSIKPRYLSIQYAN